MKLKHHVLYWATQFDMQGHIGGWNAYPKMWIVSTCVINYYPLIYFSKRIRMILHNVAELLPLRMNAGSSVTPVSIILILKQHRKVGQCSTHMATHCGINVTPLLYITYIPQKIMQFEPASLHNKCCIRWQIGNKLLLC